MQEKSEQIKDTNLIFKAKIIYNLQQVAIVGKLVFLFKNIMNMEGVCSIYTHIVAFRCHLRRSIQFQQNHPLIP